MNRRSLILATMATALTGSHAWSQTSGDTWPQRPVKFILSQPAGSGPDNVARLLAQRLATLWGQPVVVENKPGGQNTIGAQAAARAPADGHHFYFATAAALVSNVYLFKTLPYDPLKDFVPVAFVAKSPFAVLVETNSPLRTIDDLISRAKASPGKFSLGNEGPRTFSGMIARLVNARAEIDTNLVAYAAVGNATQDLMGGHVDAIVADLASTAALTRQGKLRVLAVTSGKRVAGWDAVPTLAEKLSGFDMIGWFALVAPTGTPSAVIAQVNADVNRLLADPDVVARINTIGPMAEAAGKPEQLAEFLRAEHRRWGQVSREIGLLPE